VWKKATPERSCYENRTGLAEAMPVARWTMFFPRRDTQGCGRLDYLRPAAIALVKDALASSSFSAHT
jgi:hypothetical protein